MINSVLCKFVVLILQHVCLNVSTGALYVLLALCVCVYHFGDRYG